MNPEDRRRFIHRDTMDSGNPNNDEMVEALVDKLAEGTLEKVSTNIVKDSKNTYYWLYEVNLYSNLMFLFLVIKIFFFIWIGLALFIIGLSLRQDNLAEVLENIGLPMLYVLLFLVFLVTLSYFFYALISGGRYSVLFQMDRKGIRHTQLPRQFKRAQTVGVITAIAGLLTGNFAAAGAGMLSAGNSSMHTNFKKVQSIKPKARQGIIKLRSGLMHNQVYTAAEDYDLVLKFIREHVGKSALNKR